MSPVGLTTLDFCSPAASHSFHSCLLTVRGTFIYANSFDRYQDLMRMRQKSSFPFEWRRGQDLYRRNAWFRIAELVNVRVGIRSHPFYLQSPGCSWQCTGNVCKPAYSSHGLSLEPALKGTTVTMAGTSGQTRLPSRHSTHGGSVRQIKQANYNQTQEVLWYRKQRTVLQHLT